MLVASVVTAVLFVLLAAKCLPSSHAHCLLCVRLSLSVLICLCAQQVFNTETNEKVAFVERPRTEALMRAGASQSIDARCTGRTTAR